MKLYYMAKHDCSGKVRWLLEELEVPYEEVQLNYKDGDLKQESFLKKNPLGQVPVLEDGGVRLYESYAIVAYLADKFRDQSLAPDPTDLPARGLYYQWLFFSIDSADDFFNRYFQLAQTSKDYQKQWGDYIEDKTRKILAAIEEQLDGRDYILGAFSAIDACLGYALWSISEDPLFDEFPRAQAYFSRLKARPACIRSHVFQA